MLISMVVGAAFIDIRSGRCSNKNKKPTTQCGKKRSTAFFVSPIKPWWKQPAGRRKQGGWRLQLFPLRFGVDWWTLGILTFELMSGAMAIVTHEDLGWGLGGGRYFFEQNGGPF